jgi:predicted dehydrogenase
MMGEAPVARLAVLGAGTIGRAHIERVQAEPQATLMAIVDPSPEAKALAEAKSAPWYPSLETLLANARPDGVIVATPNRMHVENGLACVAAQIPALIEKPLADDVAEAMALVEAADLAGVPLLVGHYRRHTPLIRAARAAIDDGRLGRLVAVHATCWFAKPQEYFAVAWRREPGAGPVITNLIYDIDLLRHLCGEVASVQAIQSSATRGHAVEDSAVALLRFASGVLGTVTVSDAIAAPWSWELTSGENPAYTRTGESCYMIGGTLGSLRRHAELVGADRPRPPGGAGGRSAGAADPPFLCGDPRRGSPARAGPRGAANAQGDRSPQTGRHHRPERRNSFVGWDALWHPTSRPQDRWWQRQAASHPLALSRRRRAA